MTSRDDHDRLAAIRLVVLDFDGVLTDNTVTVDADGVESVTCWRGDGLGISALKRAGVDVVVLSTETNPVVSARCAKLALECIQGVDDKAARLTDLLSERTIVADDVAYVGNDINDAGCLAMVGLPIVVADAHASVVGHAAFVTETPGGRGAVREVCDLIVAARQAVGVTPTTSAEVAT